MSITSITRDWGIVPCIVRVVSTDTLATVTAQGYLTAQLANTTLANNGVFEWLPTDSVLVSAADGNALYTISADLTSLVTQLLQTVSTVLTAAQIDGMYAAPVFVIPAPAAGKLNVIQSAALNVNYGGTVFAGGGAIALQYKNTVHGAGVLATGTIAAATLIAATSNQTLYFPVASSVVSANAIAQPVYLSNDTAAFTGGTLSVLTLSVSYTTIVAA